MPRIILRPDNFLDPDATFSRSVDVVSGSELVQKAIQAYGLKLPPRAELQIYTGARSHLRKIRLDLQEIILGTDPQFAWVFIRLAPVPPSEDPDA